MEKYAFTPNFKFMAKTSQDGTDNVAMEEISLILLIL